MPYTLQTFLADATLKTVADLETALLRLPEERRDWSPMGTARTALDQVAECVLMNEETVKLIERRSHDGDFDFEDYHRKRTELMADPNTLLIRLQESAERVRAAILTVPDGDLNNEVVMPWGTVTVAQIIAYPYWNQSYHQAQINYLAAMLGVLE